MQLRNDPKCTQALWNTPNMSLLSNGVDQVRSLRKIQCDFVARTFVLIEPVQYVSKQVSCSYGTIPNAPKYYETHRNICLGSNGVDWFRSFRKNLKWLRGTNFCINCSSSPRFASSFMQLRNDPKCTQTLWNATTHEFRVQWSGLGAVVMKKSRHDFVARTFALIAPVQPILHRVSCGNKMLPNAPNTMKCTKTWV